MLVCRRRSTLFLVAPFLAIQLGCKGTEPEPATAIALNAGDGQTATAGSATAIAPSVKVTNAKGSGVAGVSVTFAVASGGGSVTGATLTTNSLGVATVGSWTLGALAGANTLTATATGLTGSPVTFTATGLAGGANKIVASSGDAQFANVETALPSPVSVVVRDVNDNPVANVVVTFTVTSGGGAITGATHTTNNSGMATLGGWTLGPTPTINTVQASASGATPATLTARGQWKRGLKAGLLTGCAMPVGGAVRCWGENSSTHREYGVVSTTQPSSTTPVVITALPALAEIASGTGSHTCGIKPDASAVCWGRTGNGQLGDGNVTSTPAVVNVTGGINWAQISTGRLMSCGVSLTGSAYCWGSNQSGEIGKLSVATGSVGSASPVAVDGGLTFASVSAGWQHACGVTTAGAAYCWGFNAFGELGTGTTGANVLLPTAVTGGLVWSQIAAGSHHTCGITVDKKAYCWGANGSGQLGDGTTAHRSSPTLVALTGVNLTVIATNTGDGSTTGVSQLGRAHTCALTDEGKVYCWGSNDRGQLGDGTRVDRTSPTLIGGLTLNGLSLGERFTCGMRGDAVWCWGWNDSGQLGNGAKFTTPVPAQVAGGHTFQSISLGDSRSCGVIVASGGPSSTVCWGYANLGSVTSDVVSSPLLVAGSVAFTSVDASGNSCARAANGDAYCWGTNFTGEIGNASVASSGSATPVLVTGGFNFISLAVGSTFACGLTAANAAYCWGNNSNGQLGSTLPGGATSTATPTAVSGGFTFQSIAAGSTHACGVSSAGVARCWGSGASGQLGNGANTSSTTPVAVSGGHTFASISGGFNTTCGVTTTGTAYCWGASYGGVRNTPGIVTGGLTWSMVSAGGQHACGVTTGGSAYCWGSNDYQQAGHPTAASLTSPSLVGGGMTFQSVDASAGNVGAHSCGYTAGGVAYCWGWNFYGQLGNGVTHALPTRVTGF